MTYFEDTQKLYKQQLERLEFLEDEVRRCYRELEDYEVQIDRLKEQNSQLLHYLANWEWRSMHSAYLAKGRRKWRARV